MEDLKVFIRTNQVAADDQVYALNDLKKACETLIEPFDVLGFSINSVLLTDVATGGYREIGKIVRGQVQNDLKAIKTPSIRQSMENDAEQALSVFFQSCQKILAGERRDLVKFLEVVKGQVCIAAGALATIEEQNTYYLENPEEIEAYNLHLQACKTVNDFLSSIDRKPQVIWQIFKYNTDTCQVEPADFNYGFLLNKY